MGTKKKFTPEELKHLQANPYTLRVTADSISPNEYYHYITTGEYPAGMLPLWIK